MFYIIYTCKISEHPCIIYSCKIFTRVGYALYTLSLWQRKRTNIKTCAWEQKPFTFAVPDRAPDAVLLTRGDVRELAIEELVAMTTFDELRAVAARLQVRVGRVLQDQRRTARL